MNIPFIDLKTQQRIIKNKIEMGIQKVLEHGHYLMGPEVQELETQLSKYCGAKHTISCSSGADALIMALMAKNIHPGDAVFVPSFTFVATGEAVALLGATPIFVDVDPDTFNMDPKSLEIGIAVAHKQGLNPKVVITVDIFGQSADYDALIPIIEKHKLWLLCDAAQSFGASYKGKKVGTFGLITTTSFYPAKPLGCYGDGGAIFTEDDEIAETLKSIRIHGHSNHDKYDNVRLGLTARLDTIQAAILLAKLSIFDDEIEKRQKIAAYYHEGLKDIVKVPHVAKDNISVWAQYTVVLKNHDRQKVMQKLQQDGIPTAAFYPKPMHIQTAYHHYPKASEHLLVSEALAKNVLSLPMHPYLDQKTQDFIIEKFHAACEN